MTISAAERKPLFNGEFIAFSPFDRVALRALIDQAGSRRARMVEIGSWLGNGSTQVFIEALRDGRGTVCCVDTWLGNPNVERHQSLVANYDVFGTFLTNVARGGGGGIVKPLMMSSRDAASVMADGAFDLVFIDADHSYDAVQEDIRLWKSKVAPGGILCGHDCELRAEAVGMDLLVANRMRDTIPGPHTFPVIHPGSILAVHEAFGDTVKLWSQSPCRLSDGTTGCSTIWYQHC